MQNEVIPNGMARDRYPRMARGNFTCTLTLTEEANSFLHRVQPSQSQAHHLDSASYYQAPVLPMAFNSPV